MDRTTHSNNNLSVKSSRLVHFAAVFSPVLVLCLLILGAFNFFGLGAGNDQQWLPIAVLIVTITALAGVVAWSLATTVDSLHRKETELRRSVSLLDVFFEKNPTVLFVKDLEGRYYLANQACRDLVGVSKTDLMGTDGGAHLPSQIIADLRDQDNQVIQTGKALEFFGKLSQQDVPEYFRTLRFPLVDDNGQIYAVGGIATNITDRVEAQKALKESETRFRTLLESAPEAVVISDKQGHISLVNRQTETLFGHSRDELLTMELAALIPDVDLSRYQIATINRENAARNLIHMNGLKPDGEKFPVEVSLSPAPTRDELVIICIIRDITEREQLEEQLRQSQKMEAIGKLTGGMAHDFNNLLGVIMGNLELAERSVLDEKGLTRVQTAKKAALRGAELTKRMLAIARRQPLQPRPTAVNEVIEELVEILPRTLGPDITIERRLGSDLPPVLVDHSGFENVFINLAINARDAMPEGGKLMLETRQQTLGEQDSSVRQGEIAPGSYVHITVTDTGCGMTSKVLSHAFEPFFTTKVRGKGTGLGLAMIYGFVKQSNGHIRIYSEPGEGTSINIYLPTVFRAAPPYESGLRETLTSLQANSDEKILVVDDEVALLEVAVAYLEELGYQVFPATDGHNALDTLSRHPDIDLLLTDVVMPGGMNGVALAAETRKRNPDIHILYTSGFPSSALADKSALAIDAPVLTKPYNLDDLAKHIRVALDKETQAGA
ncbi:MAG: PAS domain S-box protein [Pseudohongiellaceae bacterium]